MLKEEFDLLLSHDWDENIVICIKEIYKNLLCYKYLISKITLENISQLLKLANSIKIELQTKEIQLQTKEIELQTKETEIKSLKEENELLKLKLNEMNMKFPMELI